MNAESKIISAWANQLRDEIVTTAIKSLDDLRDDCLLSGEDSGLESVWEEICVQVQQEQSFHWDSYVDTAESFILNLVEARNRQEQAALWMQSDEGMDWRQDEGNQAKDLESVPINNSAVVAMIMGAILATAADFENDNIYRYKWGQSEDSDEEEEEDVDELDEMGK